MSLSFRKPPVRGSWFDLSVSKWPIWGAHCRFSHQVCREFCLTVLVSMMSGRSDHQFHILHNIDERHIALVVFGVSVIVNKLRCYSVGIYKSSSSQMIWWFLKLLCVRTHDWFRKLYSVSRFRGFRWSSLILTTSLVRFDAFLTESL